MLSTTPLRKHAWMADLLLISIVLAVFYGIWLGSHALFTPDEGRYSEIAREMIVTGDYITPRLNGVTFLDKPVLYYWLQVSAIKLFGLNEWALRFWPACFGILGCLTTYLAGYLLFNRRTGMIATVILATSPLYYGAAHYANLDLEVAVLSSNSLLFFLFALQTEASKQRTGFLLAAYLFSALATLTKGLIGIVFPIMIVGSWIAILNRWYIVKNLRLFLGISIFLGITLPWYLLVQKANPQFFHFFFVTQQFSRFLTKEHFNNQAATWFYIPIVLAGFLPWSLFIFQALIRHIKNSWQNRQAYSTVIFFMLWISLIFIFFSLPKSKTIGYILPIFPALALLVGNYLDLFWEKCKKLFYGLAMIAGILLLTLAASAPLINQKSIKPLAMQLKPILSQNDEVVTYYRYYQDLPLYLERRITIVADWHAPDIAEYDNWLRELWFGIPFQDTSKWLIEEPTFWQRWNSHQRLFAIIYANYYDDFIKKAKNKFYKLKEYHDMILVSNKPVIFA